VWAHLTANLVPVTDFRAKGNVLAGLRERFTNMDSPAECVELGNDRHTESNAHRKAGVIVFGLGACTAITLYMYTQRRNGRWAGTCRRAQTSVETGRIEKQSKESIDLV
jgi:hypothetical protein